MVFTFVKRVGLNYWGHVISGEFFFGVNGVAGNGANADGLFLNEVDVLVHFADIQVHGNDFIAAIHEPRNRNGCVQTA